MQVYIKNIEIEFIARGRNGYNQATVTYDMRGKQYTKKVLDFSNPGTFKTLKQLLNDRYVGPVEVVSGKNDKGYDEWREITVLESYKPEGPSEGLPGNAAKTNSVSDYEKKEAQRQVLIVKQSSLSSAVAAIGPGQAAEDYLQYAQKFADWVFSIGDGTDKNEEQSDDIPY